MGKTKDLSPRKVALIKFHLKENYKQNCIASRLGISESSVSRVKQALLQDCEYKADRIQKSGRKRKISPRTERKLVKAVKKNRRATSTDLTKNLAESGVNVC
jgi:transposase